MEQRLTPAHIESRLANLPIYVYDLRDSLTYKPLKSEPWQYRSYSTVHRHPHISTALRALRIPPEKIGNLDHLILIIYPVLQIFSVGSHCQGIVTSYLPSTPIAFMPVQFLMCISIIKVHYCTIIKHARSLNNSQKIVLIYMLGH